ncbi:MAG: hypothetical protein ACD_19C00170G0001 [uncultured bacterium]|nr:MAG: hypothetical protein ACD_19C00170G0001 [uncultured bacterium]
MGCGPWELKQYAGKFHFGFIIYDYDNQLLISKNHYENFIPTKMFTYVEMGLPLIVIDKLKAAADFVKKYGIGIVVSKNELKNIEGLLDVSQESYDELCLNIQTCRHKINMDTMINELGFLFYDP